MAQNGYVYMYAYGEFYIIYHLLAYQKQNTKPTLFNNYDHSVNRSCEASARQLINKFNNVSHII